MKWRGRQGSSNVNDRRGQSGGGGMPNFGGFKMGTGGMILLLVLYLVFGRGLIGGPSGPGAGIQNGQGTPITSEREEEYKQFISVVLKDTIYRQHKFWLRLCIRTNGSFLLFSG